MNITTKRFPRTINEAFGSGTAYAASIERNRRSDRSGIKIVLGCIAIVCAAYARAYWGSM
jgi:hypothetical protein